MSFIVSIEGNIGSGKSTLLKELKKCGDLNNKFVFVQEPVDEWNNIKDSSGESILQKFYANQEEYAFSFQIMAYITRLRKILDAIEKNPDAVIISERSLETDRYVFAQMLYDEGKIREIDWIIYNYWFNSFLDKIKTNLIIYIKTSPDNCHKRITKRNRSGEVIPIEYLENCDNYHNKWLKDSTIEVITLNGNTDINTGAYHTLLKNAMNIIETECFSK